MTPKQHDRLMRKLGISKEQDEKWHRSHLTLDEQRAQASAGLKSVNCFAVGGGFLAWCAEQGWLVEQGRMYKATRQGVRELRDRFGIRV